MREFLINEEQLRTLERLQHRLHSEERMSGEVMRNWGHRLESVIRIVRELEVESDHEVHEVF